MKKSCQKLLTIGRPSDKMKSTQTGRPTMGYYMEVEKMKKELKKSIESLGLKTYGEAIMIDGTLYPLPLVEGNDKIGNVWHASTLPTDKTFNIELGGENVSVCGTCPTHCEGCYGTKGNYQRFPAIYQLLGLRTLFLKKYPDIYFKVAVFQIIAENIQLIRLHATGDFIRGEASGWYNIFKALPNVKGWTYTKCKFTKEIKALDSLDNFNIVKSIIKGCGFNFGHIDYLLKTYNRLTDEGKKPYICRCGIDKTQHCDNCKGCASNEYVLFIEHSTEYKAEKDPLYETIKAIIESQPSQAV